MKPIFISTVASLVTMLAIDTIWLRVMYSRFYQPNIGHLLAPTVNYGAAVVFYLIYTVGLSILVVLPSLEGSFSIGRTFFLGAVFGLVAYGTYDFTNHATLKDWPAIVSIVDIIWGSLLTGTVALASRAATDWLT